ncbi:unnamed protein product [Dicrocoelium dendriticum]|nr:unnamed protein product [Dicrocoelium dendriticum]
MHNPLNGRTCGVCLIELNLNEGAIKSIAIRTQLELSHLAILCTSSVIVLNMEDLQNVLWKSVFDVMQLDLAQSQNSQGETMLIRVRKLLFLHGEGQCQLFCSDAGVPNMIDLTVEKSIEFPKQQSNSAWYAPCVRTVWSVTGSRPFISFNTSDDAPSTSITSLLYAQAKRALLKSLRSPIKDAIEVAFRDKQGEPITPRGGDCSNIQGTVFNWIHGLADQRRHVICGSAVVTNDQCWLAMTDSLGRVQLLDLRKKRVVRMWKGYRDAELAFVDACEFNLPTSQPHVQSIPRRTHCLCIHAPERRILEVWRLVHGPRLAIWDVREPVRLVQVPTQRLVLSPQGQNFASPSYQAILLDTNGVVYTVGVSPDLCFACTDAEAVVGYQEYQLMQECNACLTQSYSEDPGVIRSRLVTLFGKFQTSVWFEKTLMHAIHHLSRKPYLVSDLLQDCVSLTSGRGTIPDEPDFKVSGFERLHSVCIGILSLTQCYLKFSTLINDSVSYADDVIGSGPTNVVWTDELETIADLLNWDLEEASRCFKLYAFCNSTLKSGTHLKLSRPMDLHGFVDCFHFLTNTSSDSASSSPTLHVRVRFGSDDSSIQLAKIGSLIFGCYLLGYQSFEALQEELPSDVLTPDLLLYALTAFVLYWEVYRELPTIIRRLHRIYAHLLHLFCRACDDSLSEGASTNGFSAEDSSALQQTTLENLVTKLYNYCLDTHHLSSAYLVSLITRSLVYVMWQAREQGSAVVSALCHLTKVPGFCRSPLDLDSGNEERGPPHETTSELSKVSTEWQPSSVSSEPSSLVNHLSLNMLSKLVDQWHDTCARIEGLFCLGLLVQLPATERMPAQITHEQPTLSGFPLSLGRALKLGRACLNELFASWLMRWQVGPDQLVTLYQSMCTLPSTDPLEEPNTNDVQSEMTQPVSISHVRQALLLLVYKQLPFTLELDCVMATLSWMHYQRWLNEPEALRHLQQCIAFLRSLSSAGAITAQGLATMMWRGRLLSWYGQCAAAVRTTRTEFTASPSSSMSTDKLKYVSVLLMNFMNVYLHACQKAEVVPVLSAERAWCQLSTNECAMQQEFAEMSLDQWSACPMDDDRTTPSLNRALVAELALHQPTPDIRSVASWEQATIVVSALNVFRHVRYPSGRPRSNFSDRSHPTHLYGPEDFFSPKDVAAVTTSLNPNWISTDADESLDGRRKFFITWLTECAVSSYHSTISPHSNHSSGQSSPERHRKLSANTWRYCDPLDLYTLFTSAAITLAKHWGFPKEMAVTQHVVALFESGLDEQAELYLGQLTDLSGLATHLLLILGRRVAWLAFASESPTSEQLRWRACIPFGLESWLRGLLPGPTEELPFQASIDRYPSSIDINHLAHLVEFALQHIPAQASQVRIAEDLRDAIYAMID